MTVVLAICVAVDFAFSIAAWRRQRRERREFMAEMHRQYRARFPVEYERTQVTVSPSCTPGAKPPPTR